MNNRINYAGFVGTKSESTSDEQAETESAVTLPPLDFRGPAGVASFDPVAAVKALRRIASGES
jgi:hypothetical protein